MAFFVSGPSRGVIALTTAYRGNGGAGDDFVDIDFSSDKKETSHDEEVCIEMGRLESASTRPRDTTDFTNDGEDRSNDNLELATQNQPMRVATMV